MSEGTILIVDDDPMIRTLVRSGLERNGFRVVEAEDGDLALEFLEGNRTPDLIISDLAMPDMDGFELCRRVRARPATVDTLFLFLTARTTTADKLKGFDIGADDYITKPFSMRDLVTRVNSRLTTLKSAKEKADIDPLTGLFNRRAVEERLDSAIERAARGGASLAVAMADVDRFKKINDLHGHQAGDRVLGELARIMKEEIGSRGFVGRFGGEEFLIVIEEAEEAEKVLPIIEGLLSRIERKEIFRADDGRPVKVTISVGLALFPRDGEGREELVSRSDRALYKAKGDGRNRVRAWDSSVPAGEEKNCTP